jgi:hypothetical protein
MAIISAYVIGRSINTEQIDLAAQTDKIRNQIRYAQSTAMKRSDADEIWGIKFDPDKDQYWLFFASIPVGADEPDFDAQQVIFPGEQNKKVSAAAVGVDIKPIAFPLLFFDRFGKPYTDYSDSTAPVALANDLTITISANGQDRDITLIPETGLVQ